ncbi:MAG: hypothetical protein ABJG15_10285 [Hyphomonadaceae bacterium]
MTKLSNHLPLLAIFTLSVSLAVACGGPDTELRIGGAQAQEQGAEQKTEHILQTGQSIVSLAAIPATAHLGKSHIVAAHGADGVSIRDTRGTVLATIDTPARLVAHYQNLLVVYSQSEDGVTTLKRYRLNGPGQPVLVDTASPSPIAATTLQRTSIASLGPLQISGTDLIIGDRIISAPGPITAVASASYFPPLVSSQTLLIATENGDIIIQSNK